jgi:diadenosine tetraphosphatase ApaH/serine/threonine PP2A family protein phosphatase
MKLALMSDLHGNRQATEAVWQFLLEQGFDQLALLGDYVDYGADPAWVCDFVQARVAEGAVALQGNHDEAMMGAGTQGMADHVLPSLEWTRAQLSPTQRQWLASLPLTAQMGSVLLAHANTHRPAQWGYIMGRMDAATSLHATTATHVFCGHMHDPQLYHLTPTGKTGDFTPVEEVPIPLSPARRWLAIVGSVGQPRDGNPAACCASFDTDSGTLTFHRVPYDHAEAGRRIRAAGLPAFLAERLMHGR